MIREYLKLARISIASITGLAPVIGALAVGQFLSFDLLILFLIGIFGHTYGMTHNDLIDYNLDKKTSAIKDRPLVSGTISKKQAWIFALGCLSIMFALAIILAIPTMNYLPIFLLIIPTACVSLYNIVGKKIPFADALLAIGIFFFILYGALSQQVDLDHVPLLVWIICVLGTIQMLSINVIAGGFKDVENDIRQGARTGAGFLGVRIFKNKTFIPISFVIIAYTLQILNISIAYLPLLFIDDFASSVFLRYLIFILITIIGLSAIYITWKFLALARFERGRIRMLFNLQGYINFTLAPILLMSVTPLALLIIPIPGIGFFLSTLLYHEKFMQPASM